ALGPPEHPSGTHDLTEPTLEEDSVVASLSLDVVVLSHDEVATAGQFVPCRVPLPGPVCRSYGVEPFLASEDHVKFSLANEHRSFAIECGREEPNLVASGESDDLALVLL